MDKKLSKTLLGLTGFCLLLIGVIFAAGILRDKTKKSFEESLGRVLGEESLGMVGSSVSPAIDRIIQNKIQSTFTETKETLSQKLVETEKSVVQAIEKEVSNLTQSQVDAFKYQICRDLGVSVVTPTKVP